MKQIETIKHLSGALDGDRSGHPWADRESLHLPSPVEVERDKVQYKKVCLTGWLFGIGLMWLFSLSWIVGVPKLLTRLPEL